ncbi:hypothetical protein E4M02_01455 [Brevundimonas sp. S30B]|uniref:hypothetical protein n=1 Tax=unclassified Brevundimonas TaxID=2622653 RepID=UPI001071E95D|nr:MULTISPECIES: hypothetical protein [unclassified Brevundimonas]QBX37427.1 hypothetical protein E4M01_06365 [Brevundimonas sp. MF30-B]TFW03780.1 hypothetical protein E4M02_01455 [Brevundimonas sp. S30B]
MSTQAVRAHPGFADFRQRHLTDMIVELETCRAQTPLMIEAQHQVIGRLIVGLHCASRHDQPQTWATIARLQTVVARCGLASARSVSEIVARLRTRGLVDTPRSPTDGRVRLLRPSIILVDHDRRFLSALLGGLTEIFTDGRYDAIAAGEPLAHARYRAAWAARAEETVEPFRWNAPMRLLYRRGAGMPLLFTILRDQYAQGRCELGFGELGERLGVSRTQVRGILEAGRSEGLFEFSRIGGGPIATRRMCDAFDELLSACAVAYTAILEDAESTRGRMSSS